MTNISPCLFGPDTNGPRRWYMGLFLPGAVLCIRQSGQKCGKFVRDGLAQNLLIGPAQSRAQCFTTGILLTLVPRASRFALRSCIPPVFGVIHHVTPDSWRRLRDLCPLPGRENIS
jgi:hypothetical protein